MGDPKGPLFLLGKMKKTEIKMQNSLRNLLKKKKVTRVEASEAYFNLKGFAQVLLKMQMEAKYGQQFL